MKFIAKIIVTTLAVLITTWFLPGVTITGVNDTDKLLTALMVSVALAFLNTVLKPVLAFLTLPITILTLGLFYLVLNAIIILLADKLVADFHVKGFLTALLFSIILSLVTSVLEAILGTNKKDRERD
ncbi:MAG TPA: phage holin family protein [Bacteroidia bacterium]|jgi:putative membrane protein|nr:phage holin family protein [Bacteroidia bacterium]